MRSKELLASHQASFALVDRTGAPLAVEWEKLTITWPDPGRYTTVHAMVVTEIA